MAHVPVHKLAALVSQHTKPPKTRDEGEEHGEESEELEKTPEELLADAVEEAEAMGDADLEEELAEFVDGSTTPDWVQDPEKWDEAKSIVDNSSGKFGDLDPSHVVAYLYRELGGAIRGHEEEEEEVREGHEEERDGEEEVREGHEEERDGEGEEEVREGHEEERDGEEEVRDGKRELDIDQAAEDAHARTDPQIAEKLAGYDPERDGNPPPWASDKALWDKAEEAVEPHWDNYDEPYAVVAHVYKQMGGAIE